MQVDGHTHPLGAPGTPRRFLRRSLCPEAAPPRSACVSIASTVLTVGAFWVLYQGQFVGTWSEIAGIVAVTFSADFSLDALLANVLPKMAGK